MSDPWLQATAGDLGREIGRGAIDPLDLAETYLDAARSHAAGARIYVRLTPDRTRAEATAARTRARDGVRRGPLDGVPISWKDLFDTAGIGTEAGSALLKGRIPEQDAACLAMATARGLVCLGKTHMAELAFSGLGLNPVTQTPPCVNDPAADPGGSSSGAAASVAFGMAAAGIGSDTGGSVRLPAAWNNLVGLKTTAGLISLHGVVPLCGSLDTVGPLCRSVEDAALLLEALTGMRTDLAGAGLSGARFAVCKTSMLSDLESGVAQGFEGAVRRLSSAGATLEDVEIPAVAEVLAIGGVLVPVEACAQWHTEIESRGDVMFPEIRKRFETGRQFSGVDYVAAYKRMLGLRRAYPAQTAGYDAILAPTCPILPPALDRLLTDSDYYVWANLMALRNTRVGNLLGLCALTLPTAVPGVGLMMLAPPGDDRRLLRLGQGVEQVLNTA
ncbi:MAG: amidase [Rhodobacteraceae bacterium]|nr:amidase [Paracoccaceae bacterium]